MAMQADSVLLFVSRAGLKLHHALQKFNLNVTGWVCADFGCNIGGFTDCLLQRGAAKVYAIDTGYGTLAYRLRIDPRVVVMERKNALHAVPPLSVGEGGHERSDRPGEGRGAADLVVIDLAWTQQKHSIPAALRWLRHPLPPGEGGSVAVATEPGEGRRAKDADIDVNITTRMPSPDSLRSLTSPGGRGGELPSPQPLPTGRGSATPPLIITLVKPHYELRDDEKQWLDDGRLDHARAHEVFARVLTEFATLGAEPIAHTLSPITGGKSARSMKGGGNIEFLVLLRPLQRG